MMTHSYSSSIKSGICKIFQTFLPLLLLFLSVEVNAQTDYTIGTGTATNTPAAYPTPFGDYYEGSSQQYLYRAADLAAVGMNTAGNITAIKFNVTALGDGGFIYGDCGVIEGYTIKIMSTSLTALTTTGWEVGAVTVFGPIDYQPTVGVNTFTFSTPFPWNGTSGLIVEICEGGASYTANAAVPYTTVTGVNVARIHREDFLGSLCGYSGTGIGGQTAATRVRRPNATFTEIIPVPCSGAPTIGAAQSSASTLTCNGAVQLSLASYPLNLTGISYQWQSSAAGLNAWGNIGGPLTTPAYSAPSISQSTDYRLIATCGSAPTNSSTATVIVNTISAAPATSTICDGNPQSLAVVSPLPTSPTLYSQDFNSGSFGTMTVLNNTTTGPNPAAAAWAIQPDGYTEPNYGTEFHSLSNSSFAISNSDAVGDISNVNTQMITPFISTAGYSSLTLTFNHHMQVFLGDNTGKVQVSTDGGTNWITPAGGTFSGSGGDIGAPSGFAGASVNLSAYINSNIKIRFLYTDPGYNYWWAIDDILLTGTPMTSTYTWSSASPGAGLPGVLNTPSIAVTPTNGTGAYTYTITSNNCGTSTATVNVVPGPSATIAAGAPICAGSNATITFTGVAGNIVYFHQGVTNNSITITGAGTASFTTAPLTAGNYTYVIDSIKNNTCTVTSTLSATQAVNPHPNGTFQGTSTACKDGLAYISYGSSSVPPNYPIYLVYSDGTNIYLDTANGNTANFEVPTNMAGTFNYDIVALSDVNGCIGISGTDFSGTAMVVVNELPTATITSAPGICEGTTTNVTITFTGATPFAFGFYNGLANIDSTAYNNNTLTFPVSPTTETDYYLNYIFDGNSCVADPDLLDSTTIVIYDTAAITSQPQAAMSACTNTGAVITMTATGDNLVYTWYANGVQVSGSNYVPNDNTLTINNVTSLDGMQYHVVVQGACGTPQTSSTTTLTESFDNNWTGTTSSDWSDVTNWGCGIVPMATTNAMIPAGAPNMPLVNIPAAECKDLFIAGTASVMFAGSNNLLSVYGNIVNSGTLDGTNGTVKLAGTAQSITGATTFNNLEVTGGNTKALAGDATVKGLLTLTNGYLALGSSNLIISDMDLQSTGGTASFVVTDGTGAVIGQNMGTAPRTFHVGTGGSSYTPVIIENTGDVDTFSVRVMPNVYMDGYGVAPATVTNPVVNRTWMISEQTAGGSLATITPQWNAGEEINGFDLAHVFVAHYMNNEWTSTVGSASLAPPAIGTNPYTTVETNVTSFSPFTVASSGQFPLAIRLSSITATNVGTRNKVQWKSETEDAGDSYELESSADGKKFTKIATVADNGKASTYTQWDEQPVQGVNYYRVKLVNIDGSSSYSKVVTATVRGTDGFSIEAYPNPVKNTVSVKVDGVVTGKATVVITDVTGKVVKAATQVLNNGAEINVTDLANGIYLLNYTDDVRSESIKINKQ